MPHPMDSILPADYFRAFNDDDGNDPTCLFCFKWKEDDEAIYCSRQCAVSHTLLKLTGGKTTQEDWDYLENYDEFLYDAQCINVQPAPEPLKPVAVASQTQPVASSASARLFERLSEMGKLNDELTINGLIETLEDDDNIDDSGESSLTRSLGQELADVLLDDDTRFAQSSIEEHNELADAVNVQDDAETDHIVEYGVNAETSALDGLSAEELEEMKHLGLASRLRMIYSKTGTLSKRVVGRAQSGKKPPTVLSAVPPPSPVVIPESSGDNWDDFLHIQRFLGKSGLGGPPDKSGW